MIDELHPFGLVVTGAFHPGPEDGTPTDTGTLCLVGADGERMWNVFQRAPEAHDGTPHPLDRWSRRVLEGVAETLAATALFPFGGPPWHPFIRWAERGEGARVSPVVMQVSPIRGLWLSYRGALALPERLPLPRHVRSDPCIGCPAPCTTACPVDAFAHGRYDVAACVAHVTSPEGHACRAGCLVRHTCPPGQAACPPEPQRRFHMSAFLRANAPDDTDLT